MWMAEFMDWRISIYSKLNDSQQLQMYLHALSFLHTQWVIKRQMAKGEDEGEDEDDGIDIEDEE